MLAGGARSPRNRQCWWSSTTLKGSTWHFRPDLPAGLLGGGKTRIRGATLRCGSRGSPWRPTGAWWWRAFCCGRSTIPPRTSAAPCSRGWVGGAYPTVGAVIVARRPRNPVGWLCCAVGLLLGPAFFGQDYAWYALVHEPGSLPGGQVMAWLGQWPWRVVLGLLSFLLLLAPSGRLVSARWRPVAWAAAAGTVLLGLWAAFAPEPLEGAGLERLTNPLGIHGAETIFKVLQAAAAVLLVATILAAASMVVRFRRARGEERQQLKWFTYRWFVDYGGRYRCSGRPAATASSSRPSWAGGGLVDHARQQRSSTTQ